jgi:hypothetical protein
MFNLGLVNIKNLVDDYKESRQRIAEIKNHYDYDALKKIRISFKQNFCNFNFIRLQTPQQLGVWGDTAFVSTLNPDVELIINKPNPYLPLKRDIEKNWILHIEPPGYIRKLGMNDPGVLKKFGKVYTSDPQLYEQGGRFIASPPYVHWHLALSSYTKNKDNVVYDYDFLKSIKVAPEKEVDMVVINSNMNDLPGHKVRANFISKICDDNLEFGLYGTSNWSKYKQYKGPTTNGKWPIYSKSRYVLAVENEISDYYWTEKFTDAILCYSMPIYYGCPRIDQYFPKGSYIPLDITKKTAAEELQEIMKSDFYEKNLPALIEARNLILAKQNMFSFMDSEIKKHFS